ncbi:MAG: hypothetical protein OXN86_14570 [Chloroflexota bacterium]|nr:hypothetical protein [Chloroflexota bacterium]
MKRLKRLWQIDVIRQSAIAFVVPAVVMGVGVGAALALDLGSDPDAVDISVTSDQETDALNRVAVRNYATVQGKQLGAFEAERDFETLVDAGSEAEGYEQGYRRSWNASIENALKVAILQRNAGAEGTQWVELLK